MEYKQPKNEEILQMVDGSVDGLNQSRQQNLNRLLVIQVNRNKGCEREQDRLMKKYGRNHPRINKIKNRLQYSQALAKELKMEADKAAITVPTIDINTWMVHGRVLEGTAGKPVQGITVSLHTADGKWISELGYSCTDKQGYYSIRYPTTKTTGDEKKEPPSETVVTDLDWEKGRGAADGRDMYLTVSDNDKQVCHTEREPVRIEKGKIDFRLIILGKKDCSPPPKNDDKPTPPSEPEPPSEKMRRWVVRGTVRYRDKKPASGVYVCLYDKDRLYEKDLGRLETNSRGQFKAVYREETMQEFFKKKPELYVKVLDKQGKRLYQSRKTIHSVVNDEEMKLVMKMPSS